MEMLLFGVIMLIAIGPGTHALQDYTKYTEKSSIEMQAHQGDTLDTLKCTVRDAKSAFTIDNEDDIVILDETDSNGWPTMNLLQNPSFEGSYTTIAPSWSQGSAGTGVSWNKATAHHEYGTASQQMTLASTPVGFSGGVFQQVNLPLDENGNSIVNVPYCASVWSFIGSGFGGNASATIGIEWWDAAHSVKYSTNLTTINSGAGNWYRSYIISTPPSQAQAAVVTLYVNTTATASGSIYFDACQLEMMTFANVKVPVTYAVSLKNPTMTSSNQFSNTIVDNWQQSDSATGLSFSIVNTPSIYGTSQRVIMSSVAASANTHGLSQQRIDINPSGNYTLTMTYWITAGFSDSQARTRVGVNITDQNYNYLNTTFAVEGPFGEGTSSGWKTLSVRFGPGTSNQLPQFAQNVSVFAGCVTYINPSSVTMVIGSVTLTPDFNQQPYLYASAPGATVASNPGVSVYPTPYCDNTTPGSYTDSISGLYYRQLRLFGGIVRDTLLDYTGGPECDIEVNAVDYTVLLAEAPATFLVQQSQDTAVISQAFQYAQNLGFLQGIDYTTYVIPIQTIDTMVFNWQTTRDVLSKVADYAVAAYYVDYYKFLHYAPALANATSIGLSITPNPNASPPTYPMYGFQLDSDSTQTMTSPVIEGSTQLSAPQTYTTTGIVTTISSALTASTQYTSVTVPSLSGSIAAGSLMVVWSGATSVEFAVASTVAASGSSVTIPTAAFTPSVTYAIGTNIGIYQFKMNNGAAVAQVDSLSVTSGGTTNQYTIGLASTNQFSDGFNALLDPNGGSINCAPNAGPWTIGSGPSAIPPNGSTVKIVYRFDFPVLVRIAKPKPPTTTGTGTTGHRKRPIHTKTQAQELASKQAAIDRANADLAQYQKARPIGTVVLLSPPFPNASAVNLRPGMAIPITHPPAFKTNSAVLYQIQEIDTKFFGNGIVERTMKLGFYRPNFIIQQATLARRLVGMRADTISDSVLQDVVSVSDQWILTDSITNHVTNNGQWRSTTSATFIWGDGSHTANVWG